MKVTTDSCLFGAWIAKKVRNNKSDVVSVFDIGTGTGLLSLMIAQQSNATIDAIEIDKEAYDQAIQNIAASPWVDRINIIHGDANEFLNEAQYDVIISNPPFYENELRSVSSKKNKAHHDEGLLLTDLLNIIQRNLKPGGTFYLLLPYKRNDEIEKAFAKNKLTLSYTKLVRQSTQHPFFRIMLTGKHQEDINENFTSTELTIKNELHQYTPEFISLLKDYYLQV